LAPIHLSFDRLLRSFTVQEGFLIEQLRQAEDELASSTPPSIKVKPKISLSSKIVEVWMDNRRKNCAPWKGSLPKPHVSPSRMFGDALALVIRTTCMQTRF
jgi:hypothetical protein